MREGPPFPSLMGKPGKPGKPDEMRTSIAEDQMLSLLQFRSKQPDRIYEYIKYRIY